MTRTQDKLWQNLYIGKVIYEIGEMRVGEEPNVCQAEIFQSPIINKYEDARGKFLRLQHDTFLVTYNLDKYGKLLFTDFRKAYEALNKLPKPGQLIYQIQDGQIKQRTVKTIRMRPEVFDCGLGIYFRELENERCDMFSFEEIGKTLFTSENDASRAFNETKEPMELKSAPV